MVVVGADDERVASPISTRRRAGLDKDGDRSASPDRNEMKTTRASSYDDGEARMNLTRRPGENSGGHNPDESEGVSLGLDTDLATAWYRTR